MPLEEPAWWYADGDAWQAKCLAPISSVYAWAARRRLASAAVYESRLPVICVGNFTAGGTGKTPLTIFLCQRLAAEGQKPVVLTRGYGGKSGTAFTLDLTKHTADDCGDEALLLAKVAPVVVSADRAAGAKLIERDHSQASVIIMDDGLQNPTLTKDFTVALIDALRGFGNGRVIPSGPLRAPLTDQFRIANAVIINRPPNFTARVPIPYALRGFSGPVLQSQTHVAGDVTWLKGAKVVAFAGIAAPRRFFDLVLLSGARLEAKRTFADHHDFTETDAKELMQQADAAGAILVTTEKDMARLSGGPALVDLAKRARTIAIEPRIDAQDLPILDKLLSRMFVDKTAREAARAANVDQGDG